MEVENAKSITEINIPNMNNISPLYNGEDFNYLRDLIESQYQEFKDLGTNYLQRLNQNEKETILVEFIEYIRENFISTVYYDEIQTSKENLLKIGQVLYEFICVDSVNNFIPHFISIINCLTVEQLDKYVENKLKQNDGMLIIKKELLETFSNIINKLKNLRNIYNTLLSDKKYKFMLSKNVYYYEIINYSDINTLFFNFIRPVFILQKDTIVWRV